MNRDGVPVAHGAIDMLLVTIGYHTAIMIFGVLSLVLCPYLPRMLGGEVGFLLGLGFSIFFALNVAMILFLFLPGPARRIWPVGHWSGCPGQTQPGPGEVGEKAGGAAGPVRPGGAADPRHPRPVAPGAADEHGPAGPAPMRCPILSI